MRARILGFAITVATLALGCGSSSGAGGSDVAKAPAPKALTLSPVVWNLAKADVGRVDAVVEKDRTVVVLGSLGALVFEGGALAEADLSVKTWRSAAAIASPDGLATWTVGIDGEGHLRRVRAPSPAEDVTDRYGLSPSKVLDLAGDGQRVAFLLDGGFAVGDGKAMTKYEAKGQHAITARAGKVALAVDGGLRVLDGGKESDVAMPGASFVAYDDRGGLVAATAHAVYRVKDGALEIVYDAGARTIHQLTAAGQNVWFSVDGDLGLLTPTEVSLGVGGTLAPDARLVGSASGDVWVMMAGQLSRMAAGVSSVSDEATWSASVQPVNAAVCSGCHSPAGSGRDSSNVDLSTYASWSSRKAKIHARVVQQAGTPTAMPPTSASQLTADQKAAIEAWSKP